MPFGQHPIGTVTTKFDITNDDGQHFFQNPVYNDQGINTSGTCLGGALHFNIDTDAIKLEISFDGGVNWYPPQALVNGDSNTINISVNGMIQNKDKKGISGFVTTLKDKAYFDIIAQSNAELYGSGCPGCVNCQKCG